MKRNRRATVLFIVLALTGAAMLGCAVLIAHGADRPAEGSSPDQSPSGMNLSGTVESFNYGPRGEVEGMLLGSVTGDVSQKNVQVNFPPQLGPVVRQSVTVGDAVKAVVRRHGGPRRDDDVQPAFEFVSLTDAKGKTLSSPRPDDRKAVHLEGKVKTLNYDRQGRPNGAQLESGEVVLLGPGKAKVLALATGSKLTVDGITQPSPTGIQAIDAHTVNGIMLKELDGPREGDRRPPRDADGAPRMREGDGPRGMREGDGPRRMNDRNPRDPAAGSPRREGGRPEAQRPDSPRPDGPRPEAQREGDRRPDGARRDGQRDDGPRPDGPRDHDRRPDNR